MSSAGCDAKLFGSDMINTQVLNGVLEGGAGLMQSGANLVHTSMDLMGSASGMAIDTTLDVAGTLSGIGANLPIAETVGTVDKHMRSIIEQKLGMCKTLFATSTNLTSVIARNTVSMAIRIIPNILKYMTDVNANVIDAALNLIIETLTSTSGIMVDSLPDLLDISQLLDDLLTDKMATVDDMIGKNIIDGVLKGIVGSMGFDMGCSHNGIFGLDALTKIQDLAAMVTRMPVDVLGLDELEGTISDLLKQLGLNCDLEEIETYDNHPKFVIDGVVADGVITEDELTDGVFVNISIPETFKTCHRIILKVESFDGEASTEFQITQAMLDDGVVKVPITDLEPGSVTLTITAIDGDGKYIESPHVLELDITPTEPCDNEKAIVKSDGISFVVNLSDVACAGEYVHVNLTAPDGVERSEHILITEANIEEGEMVINMNPPDGDVVHGEYKASFTINHKKHDVCLA